MFKNTFIFILSVFCFFSVWQINSKSHLTQFGNGYETYTLKNTSFAKIIPTENLKFNAMFNKYGESVIVKDADIQKILTDLNAEIVFSETTDDGINVYAYSNKLKNKITLNNRKVNLQIFNGNNKTVVGTPIIFGSF